MQRARTMALVGTGLNTLSSWQQQALRLSFVQSCRSVVPRATCRALQNAAGMPWVWPTSTTQTCDCAARPCTNGTGPDNGTKLNVNSQARQGTRAAGILFRHVQGARHKHVHGVEASPASASGAPWWAPRRALTSASFPSRYIKANGAACVPSWAGPGVRDLPPCTQS